jgi:hypothetical protein
LAEINYGLDESSGEPLRAQFENGDLVETGMGRRGIYLAPATWIEEPRKKCILQFEDVNFGTYDYWLESDLKLIKKGPTTGFKTPPSKKIHYSPSLGV